MLSVYSSSSYNISLFINLVHNLLMTNKQVCLLLGKLYLMARDRCTFNYIMDAVIYISFKKKMLQNPFIHMVDIYTYTIFTVNYMIQILLLHILLSSTVCMHMFTKQGIHIYTGFFLNCKSFNASSGLSSSTFLWWELI